MLLVNENQRCFAAVVMEMARQLLTSGTASSHVNDEWVRTHGYTLLRKMYPSTPQRRRRAVRAARPDGEELEVAEHAHDGEHEHTR